MRKPTLAKAVNCSRCDRNPGPIRWWRSACSAASVLVTDWICNECYVLGNTAEWRMAEELDRLITELIRKRSAHEREK